jgi:hypothetical protein
VHGRRADYLCPAAIGLPAAIEWDGAILKFALCVSWPSRGSLAVRAALTQMDETDMTLSAFLPRSFSPSLSWLGPSRLAHRVHVDQISHPDLVSPASAIYILSSAFW